MILSLIHLVKGDHTLTKGALSPDALVRVTPQESFVDSLSPDGLVSVTPLENFVDAPHQKGW